MTSNNSTKMGDPKLDGPIVLVFGLTGAGKSTYINNITGASLPVRDDLYSCTKTAEAPHAMIEGVDVAFVDTPGFNDPERSDAEILHSTATWIAENLGGTRKITTVLYLHSIEETKDVAERRQMQHMGGPWKLMLDAGARIHEIGNDKKDCFDLTIAMLEGEPVFIQLQEEIKNQDCNSFSDTACGNEAIIELQEQINFVQTYIHDLDKLRTRTTSVEVLKAAHQERTDAKKKLDQLRNARNRMFQKWVMVAAKAWGISVVVISAVAAIHYYVGI
ncbi:hypothetical protein L207DRAFT_530362 [Hyaloscypha variabilis F]|uniref:G domain-containing protein n=1 Tax=Hyaloscypha variabilis (strain UAMH 11265 / GT02V1 / F) TaxID=1149755 RepID=A0A2J6RK71_HYAVF|nr:hypothetical protein L207DRAFT_530362 [Hyaloscypha variabilis F]